MPIQRRNKFRHAFVDTLPNVLEEGVLYVSMRYATAAHNCFCGCGREVATPMHPTKWQLSFDGKEVSLVPSVGSWSLPCQSHYWLRNGHVAWAEKWSCQQIADGRARDRALEDAYLGKGQQLLASPVQQPRQGLLRRIWRALTS